MSNDVADCEDNTHRNVFGLMVMSETDKFLGFVLSATIRQHVDRNSKTTGTFCYHKNISRFTTKHTKNLV